MPSSSNLPPPGGQHRANGTDPVRRWDDNLYGLWRYLRWSIDLGGAAVLLGLFAGLTTVFALWPGAGIGLGEAAGRALVLVLGLYGLLLLAVTALSLLLSLVDAAVSLFRLLRRRLAGPLPTEDASERSV